MSYNNFKATVWSKYIEKELEKSCVMLEDCNRQHDGEIKRAEKVKILGVGRPTLFDYTGSAIGTPEHVADSSVFLEIEKAKAFNFAVDDIDRAQGVEGLMEALTEESSKALAEARDGYIAGKCLDAGKLTSSTQTNTAALCKTAVDTAFEWLWSNGVKINDGVSVIIAPWFYSLFKDKLTELYTDNVELIRKGVIGRYNGAEVRISDNLYNDGTDDYMMIRTKRAIAFAGQIQQVEAYRPHDLFADALKGLDVYGAKVVRPKEMYVIKAHK